MGQHITPQEAAKLLLLLDPSDLTQEELNAPVIDSDAPSDREIGARLPTEVQQATPAQGRALQPNEPKLPSKRGAGSQPFIADLKALATASPKPATPLGTSLEGPRSKVNLGPEVTNQNLTKALASPEIQGLPNWANILIAAGAGFLQGGAITALGAIGAVQGAVADEASAATVSAREDRKVKIEEDRAAVAQREAEVRLGLKGEEIDLSKKRLTIETATEKRASARADKALAGNLFTAAGKLEGDAAKITLGYAQLTAQADAGRDNNLAAYERAVLASGTAKKLAEQKTLQLANQADVSLKRMIANHTATLKKMGQTDAAATAREKIRFDAQVKQFESVNKAKAAWYKLQTSQGKLQWAQRSAQMNLQMIQMVMSAGTAREAQIATADYRKFMMENQLGDKRAMAQMNFTLSSMQTYSEGLANLSIAEGTTYDQWFQTWAAPLKSNSILKPLIEGVEKSLAARAPDTSTPKAQRGTVGGFIAKEFGKNILRSTPFGPLADLPETIGKVTEFFGQELPATGGVDPSKNITMNDAIKKAMDDAGVTSSNNKTIVIEGYKHTISQNGSQTIVMGKVKK